MRRLRTAVIAVTSGIGFWLVACIESTDNDTVEFTAALSAANEVTPPTGSPTATGISSLSLDEDRRLTVTIDITGDLTSNVSMAHIHGPAAAGANAGIILDFVPDMSAIISAGTRTGALLNARYNLDNLTVSQTGVLRVHADSLIAFLNTGRAYVNVHTAMNGAGEVRGQILRQ